jgi:fructokinase
MMDVVALGEILIDFTPVGTSDTGIAIYEANPGGAPANVAVSLSRLGLKAAFIGKVGKDLFGEELIAVLQKNGVDTSSVAHSPIHTTLAFVHLDSDGERSFSFCRNPGADMMLSWEEVSINVVGHSTIFHFGSISMTHEPSKSATLTAVRCAKNKQITISYDPNYRSLLWRDPEHAKQEILQGMEYADIVKLSEEELELLAGTKDLIMGTRNLFEQYANSLLVVTLGNKGCFFRKGEITGFCPGYKVSVVDTTGAGDAFWAGVLYGIVKQARDIRDLTQQELQDIMKFANAMGAIVVTRKGGIPAMPELSEILQMLSH